MRTDRNNNPTAMTTAVAKEGGLVENVDYAQGDSFVVPGDKGPVTYYTAKLLLNPIELTIRVLDRATFFVAHGGARWTYIAIPKFVWDGLAREVKVAVIGWMYQHEGGVAMRSFFPTT